MGRAGTSLIRRTLRSLYRSLVAFGSLWVLMPPAESGTQALPAPPPKPGGIPCGHPERLCPELELTEIEWALEYQLRDLA